MSYLSSSPAEFQINKAASDLPNSNGTNPSDHTTNLMERTASTSTEIQINNTAVAMEIQQIARKEGNLGEEQVENAGLNLKRKFEERLFQLEKRFKVMQSQGHEMKKTYEVDSEEHEELWGKMNLTLTLIESLQGHFSLRNDPQKCEMDQQFQTIQENLKQCVQQFKDKLEVKLLKLEEIQEKCNQSLTEIACLQDQYVLADQQQKSEIAKLSNHILEMHSQLRNLKDLYKRSETGSPDGTALTQKVDQLQLQLGHLTELQEKHEKDKSELQDTIKILQSKINQSNLKLSNYENLIMSIKKNTRSGNQEDKLTYTDMLSNALISASENGLINFVHFLLEIGADFNPEYKKGITPLSIAFQNGHKRVIDELLNYGADINRKDNNGFSLLHKAAEKGQFYILTELIQRGANVNITSKNNDTPLHRSVRSGHLAIVNELLSYGSDINFQNDCCETPLHLAVHYDNLCIVDKLLQNGAKIDCRNEKSETPLHLAVSCHRLEIVNKLLSHGPDINCKNENNLTPLHYCVQHGYLDILNLLIRFGADINCKSNNDLTPLHYAIENANIEIVNELLRNRANVNCKNKNNETPLHWAIQDKHLDIVRRLIRCGSQIDCTNDNGDTPLLLALCLNRNQSESQLSFVKLQHQIVNELVCQGADINCKNKWGKSALDIAVDRNLAHLHLQRAASIYIQKQVNVFK